MIRTLVFAIALEILGITSAAAGQFVGELKLYPEGCQKSESRKCRLDGLLTYKSSTGKHFVWQTDSWSSDKFESGTTDGASIPSWAQEIIGNPYDPSYLKAAIVHDHYCYKENRVRSWRETHRMFYDALIDLGIQKSKAKIMYFAVYAFGPKWIEIVPGENCGYNCIKSVLPTSQRSEGHTYLSQSSQNEIAKMKVLIIANENIPIEDIENHAKKLNPTDFFLKHGDTYVPTGPKDQNIFSAM